MSTPTDSVGVAVPRDIVDAIQSLVRISRAKVVCQCYQSTVAAWAGEHEVLQSGSSEISGVAKAFQIFLDKIITTFDLEEDCTRLMALFEGSACMACVATWH